MFDIIACFAATLVMYKMAMRLASVIDIAVHTIQLIRVEVQNVRIQRRFAIGSANGSRHAGRGKVFARPARGFKSLNTDHQFDPPSCRPPSSKKAAPLNSGFTHFVHWLHPKITWTFDVAVGSLRVCFLRRAEKTGATVFDRVECESRPQVDKCVRK